MGHERTLKSKVLPHLQVDASGTMVVAGGASGTLYLWNASSGRLLSTTRAHARSVARARLTAGGHDIVTGGEDALVRCWALVDLAAAGGNSAVSPRWTGCAAAAVVPPCHFTCQTLCCTMLHVRTMRG